MHDIDTERFVQEKLEQKQEVGDKTQESKLI